jgi:neutral ceramidase
MDILFGYARCEITPKGSVPMGGYGAREGPSVGVHDSLYAKVLAFKSQDREWVMTVLDLVGLNRSVVERLRKAVRDETGLPCGSLSLSCTHTHSGPQTVEHPVPGMPPLAEEYLDQVASTLPETVRQAQTNLSPLRMRTAIGRVNRVAANRRRPPSSRQESEVSDDSDDSFMGVVKFNEVTLFNFACHPTVLGHGNRLISADLFGAAQRSAESATGAPCAFVQGAAGDLSTRFTRREQSFAEVDRLGTLLAEAGVALAAGAKESATFHGLDRIERTLELPGKLLPDPDQARQEVREGRQRLSALRGGGSDAGTLRLAQTELEGRIIEEALASSGAEQYRLCHVSAVRIGAVALVTVPGELFSALGRRIRERSPFPLTYILGYTDGHVGYLPGVKEYEAGGYEALASPLVPDAGDRVVEACVGLLESLKRNLNLREELAGDT